jgi:arylsulfatase A-like enzyme
MCRNPSPTLWAAFAATLCGTLAGASPPPNIVIIFTDDQGYADVGVYGAQGYTTPNLDRMAAEGMRFTDFYVAQPVCSASRAALLTGCYPNRIGITGALGPRSTHGIHDEETTLAELCRSRGYATAIFGKWHLGHHPEFLPLRHGFDEYYGIPYSNDMWPLHPAYAHFPPGTAERKRGYPDLPLFEGNQVVDPEVTADDQKRFTRDLTERSVAFINERGEGPFLLYVAHPMVHVPLHVSDEFANTTAAGLYGDVISEIDWSVGRILGALRAQGIDESDNGPWLSYGDHAGSAAPLREGKGTTFEGGVRVPCIMRWPGKIPAGQVCREPIMTIDIFPTVAALVGAELPARAIDGRDVGALLLGDSGVASPLEAYFFYYHRNDLEAVRSGRWKLHFPHKYRSMEGQAPGSGGTPGKYDWDRRTRLELYDLHTDVAESRDVAGEHPDVVARLTALADAMRRDLGDDLTEVEGTGRRPPGRHEQPTEDH